MILLHNQLLQLYFGIGYQVIGTKVGVEFIDEMFIVTKSVGLVHGIISEVWFKVV